MFRPVAFAPPLLVPAAAAAQPIQGLYVGGNVDHPPAMADTAPDLLDDIEALRALVLEQRAELVLARSGLVEQRYESEALKARLATLLRITFGQSSEKLRAEIERLELLLADREEQAAEAGTTATAAATKSKDHTKPVRAPLPEALPRAIIRTRPAARRQRRLSGPRRPRAPTRQRRDCRGTAVVNVSGINPGLDQRLPA